MIRLMDSAVWGFVGVLAGSLVALIGQFVTHFHSVRTEREKEEARIAKEARDERKACYLRLLVNSRRLRYVARGETEEDMSEVNALRTDLTSAYYEIEILASPMIAERAKHLRRTTFDYYNLATKEKGARNPDIYKARDAVRTAADEFMDEVRPDVLHDAMPR